MLNLIKDEKEFADEYKKYESKKSFLHKMKDLNINNHNLNLKTTKKRKEIIHEYETNFLFHLNKNNDIRNLNTEKDQIFYDADYSFGNFFSF